MKKVGIKTALKFEISLCGFRSSHLVKMFLKFVTLQILKIVQYHKLVLTKKSINEQNLISIKLKG